MSHYLQGYFEIAKLYVVVRFVRSASHYGVLVHHSCAFLYAKEKVALIATNLDVGGVIS